MLNAFVDMVEELRELMKEIFFRSKEHDNLPELKYCKCAAFAGRK